MAVCFIILWDGNICDMSQFSLLFCLINICRHRVDFFKWNANAILWNSTESSLHSAMKLSDDIKKAGKLAVKENDKPMKNSEFSWFRTSDRIILLEASAVGAWRLSRVP
ncbi:hypothetical protein O3G_MSEX014584 [Manduca sexta]|uniref:Uncharacterized protein n=1 Tax=Manduca sexta TaxID=7130 RepID=A0A921ZVW4_MANSE|nr:hypothetical protein O3G_MSEX014584 [Manduca sexta]